MKYLVTASTAVEFASDEQLTRFLEEEVMPTFEYLMKLEREKKIFFAATPVGERTLVFIAEAASNEELDEMLRRIPMWPMADVKVTALEPIAVREKEEREYLQQRLAAAHR